MSILTIFAIAFALAMDAFAVALTAGVCNFFSGFMPALRMALMFGFCQFIMPVAGWLLGVKAQAYIESYDHWLAFGLLLLVGGKMIKEAWENRGKEASECTYTDPTKGWSLIMLGVATSLDALAIGLSFALLDLDIWLPAVIIGLVCFALTIVAVSLGRLVAASPALSFLGNLGNKANFAGGLVLVAIGMGILHEHGVFA